MHNSKKQEGSKNHFLLQFNFEHISIEMVERKTSKLLLKWYSDLKRVQIFHPRFHHFWSQKQSEQPDAR
jgi:hypothetical protein